MYQDLNLGGVLHPIPRTATFLLIFDHFEQALQPTTWKMIHKAEGRINKGPLFFDGTLKFTKAAGNPSPIILAYINITNCEHHFSSLFSLEQEFFLILNMIMIKIFQCYHL